MQHHKQLLLKTILITSCKIILFGLFGALISCSSYNCNAYILTQSVNVNPSKKKWIIDEPTLKNIDIEYEPQIIDGYKKFLSKKVENLKYIGEFNSISTIKKAIKSDLNILSFYKEQTNYDYLIETEISLVKNDLPSFQLYPNQESIREIYAKIMVYDLNSKSLIFEKEYNITDTFEDHNDIAFSPKLKKFIHWSIKKVTKDLGKKYNWSATEKVSNK